MKEHQFARLENHLQSFGYSLHVQWHQSSNSWTAILRDANGEIVSRYTDATLAGAIEMAALKSVEVPYP
jgi:hypothetical protein